MKGYTLVEIMIVVITVGITLSIITPTLMGTIRRRALESHIQGLSGAIKKSRADAMQIGTRTVTIIGSGINGTATRDFDGDGKREHFITFVDNNRDGNFSTFTDRILYKEDWGDVEIATNTLSPIVFLPAGTMIERTGSVNIKFPENETEYSLVMLSILGATRVVRVRM